MPALRAQSERLTGLLAELLTAAGPRVRVLPPPAAARRGCQISLQVPGGAGALVRELAGRGIICDVREPDVLRVAPVPLYNRFHDVWAFASTLRELLGG
jgi:kynureninase